MSENILMLLLLCMEDDCFLPFNSRAKSKLMEKAVVTDDVLFNGKDCDDEFWEGEFDVDVTVELADLSQVEWVEFILDSDLKRVCWNGQKWYKKDFAMKCNTYLDDEPLKMPDTLLKSFSVFADCGDGQWKSILEEDNNTKRVVRIETDERIKRIKIVPHGSWGSEKARIYSIHIK